MYLVVSDGYWFGRRFVDFFWSVPRIRGLTEVLGPFAPPEGEEALVPFIESMRGRIVERLEERRDTRSHDVA